MLQHVLQLYNTFLEIEKKSCLNISYATLMPFLWTSCIRGDVTLKCILPKLERASVIFTHTAVTCLIQQQVYFIIISPE